MTAETNDKRRKFKRHALPQPVKVVNSANSEPLGTVVNMSQDGLLIAGRQALEVDHLYQLELQFSEPFMGINHIKIGVDCLWNDAAQEGHLYWSGCHMIDYSPQDAEIIKEMLSFLEEGIHQ